MMPAPPPSSAAEASAPRPASNLYASLLIATLPWDREGGFAAARPRIADHLALGVGGVVIEGGEQDAVRALAKELQLKSRHPLLIAAELERGAGQTFAGATGLPPLAAIVALGDREALRRAARLTAREARTMGVNWNLAPTCDLDLSPGNPVVGARTFGSDPKTVAALAAEWIDACQAEGVLACAKYFPGLGRVTTDPSLVATRVDATADQLKETDLLPFRSAIDAGVASMMVGHVVYSALDPARLPVPASREVLQWFLRQQLKYDNLIVADRINAPGLRAGLVAAGVDPAALSEAQVAVLALRAGCDLLLGVEDPVAVASAIERAAADGTLDRDRLQQSMRRRLKWAQWASPPNDWRRPSGADTAWGSLLADRVTGLVGGSAPPMGSVVEVAVADDTDRDGVGGTAETRVRPLLAALRHGGGDARFVEQPTRASGGPLIVAVFGDIGEGEDRLALDDHTVARVTALRDQARALEREMICIHFAHPRLADPLVALGPTVGAWSADAVMQQAAARWVLRQRR
jgi:beta-glucosidase-like glycosyl hydrolase